MDYAPEPNLRDESFQVRHGRLDVTISHVANDKMVDEISGTRDL